MGRNQRHKKDVRAEKAKVKLKQTKTKFLPKGQNVTNTSFKIKPIVLSEQLKEKDTDVPLSRRKLDVKDLLSRIKHYNENVRHSACEELEEMIKIFATEIINHHLSEIILNVSILMQDREHKVRKAAVKVINTILVTIPETKLEPFFNYFSTNLNCAMTNIDKNVQENSLEFLDCFLKYAPRFISQTSEKLLPNFFSLISKLRSNSNLGRVLTVNLNSKITSVTWRITVLSRLHAVLESILQGYITGDYSENMDVSENCKYADGCSTFPIYKNSFCEVLESPMINFGGTDTMTKGPDVLNRHVITLVPLLYETWLEVVPEKKIGKGVNESTILNEEAAAILSCVMNTLHLLWKYVKKNENEDLSIKNTFLTSEGKKFLNHLLTNFPYRHQGDKKAKQKKSSNIKLLETHYDPKCVKENLLICYMYCILNVNYLNNFIKIEMEAVTMYITKCLLIKNYVNNNGIEVLIEFLRNCLVENPRTWKRTGADLKCILENTITFYNQNVVGEKNKLEIFNILLNVTDVSSLNRSQQYNVWLNSLPDLLCQSKISDVLVEALLMLSRRNNEVFNKALLKATPTILENLDNLNIILTNTDNNSNEDVVKRNIVNLFFFLPVLYREQIGAISNFITKHPYSKYNIYFVDMLKLRLEMKYNEAFENELRKYSFWNNQ